MATKRYRMDRLRRIIAPFPKAIVAYSGGVDSSLLLRLCSDWLGSDNVIAVTGVSQTYTAEEATAAREFASALHVEHIMLETDELACREFAENPSNRCYYCKRELFQKIAGLAERERIPIIFDATNADDLADFRPGRKAAAEYGVVSPFVRAGFSKSDIRDLSKRLGLPSWAKPANPCLASRVPYGMRITEEALEKIRAGEKFIRDLGFPIIRLRHHDRLARLEVPVGDFERFLQRGNLRKIIAHLKSLGYLWITLDIEGYRTGSLNVALKTRGEAENRRSRSV